MPAHNERFGATAAGSADLKVSAKTRRCAKPPSRCRQAAKTSSSEQRLDKRVLPDSAVDKERKR